MNEVLVQLNVSIINPDRIPVAVLAVILSMVVGLAAGPFRGNANPFMWSFFDILWGRAGDRLDKKGRSRGDLIFRGFVFTVFGLAFSLFIGNGFLEVSRSMQDFGILEILFLTVCISTGAVWTTLLRLCIVMEKKGKFEGAFFSLSRSTRYNLNSTDQYGIVRAGVGFAGVSFDKGLVAPVFWYLIGGAPVLAAYSLLSAFVWRFGRCGHVKGFGETILAMEKLMGFVPSYLSGFLLAAASAVSPKARTMRILGAWWAVKNKASYEQGGPVLTAIAWPMDVMIGGPVQDLVGVQLKNDWIGPEGASARLDHGYLKRVAYVHFAGCLLFLATLGGAYIFSGRFWG